MYARSLAARKSSSRAPTRNSWRSSLPKKFQRFMKGLSKSLPSLVIRARARKSPFILMTARLTLSAPVSVCAARAFRLLLMSFKASASTLFLTQKKRRLSSLMLCSPLRFPRLLLTKPMTVLKLLSLMSSYLLPLAAAGKMSALRASSQAGRLIFSLKSKSQSAARSSLKSAQLCL